MSYVRAHIVCLYASISIVFFSFFLLCSNLFKCIELVENYQKHVIKWQNVYLVCACVPFMWGYKCGESASQPASKWKVLGVLPPTHRHPNHSKKPAHNNDRKFCCSNMHALLYGITWLHLLCGGDRWMRFTRLISSTKYKMCACVRAPLSPTLFLFLSAYCVYAFFFSGRFLIQCCRQSRYVPYIKCWNENSQVKFCRWGWPAICRHKQFFFSIHSVNTLDIF